MLVLWFPLWVHGSSLCDWVGELRQRKLRWVLGIGCLGIDKEADLAVGGMVAPVSNELTSQGRVWAPVFVGQIRDGAAAPPGSQFLYFVVTFSVGAAVAVA